MLWIISNVLSCTSDVVDCIECGSVVLLMLWIVSNVAQLCLQAYNLFDSLFLSCFAFIFSLDPLLDIRNVTVLKKLNTLSQGTKVVISTFLSHTLCCIWEIVWSVVHINMAWALRCGYWVNRLLFESRKAAEFITWNEYKHYSYRYFNLTSRHLFLLLIKTTIK